MSPALARHLDSNPSSAGESSRPSLAKAAQQTAIVRALLDQLDYFGNDDDLRSQIADELRMLGRRLIDIAGAMEDDSSSDLAGEQSGIIRKSGLR
ncbi:MAG: hypothetical protein ABI551_20875 [Polyangiaceae bacterium]